LLRGIIRTPVFERIEDIWINQTGIDYEKY